MYAKLQREGLWDKFYMDAPARGGVYNAGYEAVAA
jgi:hypothetical protein